MDHSIVESFAQGGRTCITSRVYPTKAIGENAKLYLFNNATGSKISASVEVHQMTTSTSAANTRTRTTHIMMYVNSFPILQRTPYIENKELILESVVIVLVTVFVNVCRLAFISLLVLWILT